MNNLLDTVIEAYGGLERWRQIEKLEAHISVGGGIFHLKGWPAVFADARVALDPHRQHIEFTPFRSPGESTLFAPGRVAIVDNGKTIEERLSPRQSFEGHGLQIPWDALHLAYFTGYAMWGYLTMPFLFKSAGFHSEEIGPWREGDETWNRLKVVFPVEIHAHCREQIFYFDSAGLLRRHDYRVDVIGSGSTSAHYTHDHKIFGGFMFPTKRRVYSIGADNLPYLDRVHVSIDVHTIDLK